MSPRVKLVYAGDGNWIATTARIGECPHPRGMLRFDSRYALPIAVYCLACGQDRLSPLHGLTEADIADARERAAELLDRLSGYPVAPVEES